MNDLRDNLTAHVSGLILLLIMLMPLAAKSQIDTTALLSDSPAKSPRGAMLRSMVIPGWGQYYTENYLKGSLFLVANSAFFSRMLHYNGRYNSARDKTANLLLSSDPDASALELADIERRDARDKRGQSAWFLGLSYAICMIDAYVDASLYKFDDIMDMGILPAGTDGGVLAIRIRL